MMPSAMNVYFSAVLSVWICQLDAVPLYSSMGELPEISGDEVQEVNVQAPTEQERWHRMAKQLQNDVKTLRDEQFIRDFGETVNMSLFESERINTPVFKASDGCYLKNFSTERCLGRIYNVLMWYKENLNYIERENRTTTLMNNVKHEMKRLLESINSQLQSKDVQVEDISSSLHAKSAWTQKTVTHSILFNLTNVMIDTCRAIPYLSKSKAGHSQRTKNKKKTDDWISDKN
ncbi:interleukin-6 [Misgurnus anguillicaudatus]|uniref:interleukin-6 n=1 Tax=Misgurnus anguillicaudatus TaxID=75329 RepID=UPI0024353E95|nr:interleukin-6 [Misgurnus anguillicaudatus]